MADLPLRFPCRCEHFSDEHRRDMTRTFAGEHIFYCIHEGCDCKEFKLHKDYTGPRPLRS